MPTVYVATILLYKSGWNTFSFWLKSNSALTAGKGEPLCTSGVWYEAVGHHSFFCFFFSSSRISYFSDPTPNKPICWLQLHLVFGTGSPQCAGESSPGGCGEEKSATLPHSNPVPDLRVAGLNHNSCIYISLAIGIAMLEKKKVPATFRKCISCFTLGERKAKTTPGESFFVCLGLLEAATSCSSRQLCLQVRARCPWAIAGIVFCSCLPDD